MFSIARGQVPGISLVRKFGRNPTLSTEEMIRATSADLVWPTSAAVPSIVSGSGNDDEGGTHAEKLFIQGLDANFDLQSETVTLDGTTPANAVNSYIRIFRAYVSQVGTYGNTNEGAITVSLGGVVQITILAGRGQTETTLYTIPRGKTGHLHHVEYSVDGAAANAANINFWRREAADKTSGADMRGIRLIESVTGVVGSGERHLEFDGILTEKTDLWMSAAKTAGGATIGVELAYTLYLVDN